MIKEQLVATKIDGPKINIDNSINFEQFIEDIYNEALNNLIQQLKTMDPDASDDFLRLFAIVYFDLIFTHEYDANSMNYYLVCTPKWKDINDVNTNSEEFMLLHRYCMDK